MVEKVTSDRGDSELRVGLGIVEIIVLYVSIWALTLREETETCHEMLYDWTYSTELASRKYLCDRARD